MAKKTITIKIEEKTELYNEIPIEKPLVPVIFLYEEKDSVEINEF